MQPLPPCAVLCAAGRGTFALASAQQPLQRELGQGCQTAVSCPPRVAGGNRAMAARTRLSFLGSGVLSSAPCRGGGPVPAPVPTPGSAGAGGVCQQPGWPWGRWAAEVRLPASRQSRWATPPGRSLPAGLLCAHAALKEESSALKVSSLPAQLERAACAAWNEPATVLSAGRLYPPLGAQPPARIGAEPH